MPSRNRSSGWKSTILANPDGDLRFALLSDWVDAPTETLPSDDELLAVAVDGIAKLNERHGPAPGGGERFFLFHRKRVWNECQREWMGWERKRGKLHELNQLLRGSTNTTFVPIAGQAPEMISGVRYVITLDADTRLPRGAAARLVGTMAHPLNRPIFSRRDGRVVDGYSLVQPRITPTLSDRSRRIALPENFFRSERDRSLCLRSLGRLSGPVQGRFVHRKRNL